MLERTLHFKVGTVPYGAVYDLENLVVGERLYATQVCGVWALHRESLPRALSLVITKYEPGLSIAADKC